MNLCIQLRLIRKNKFYNWNSYHNNSGKFKLKHHMNCKQSTVHIHIEVFYRNHQHVSIVFDSLSKFDLSQSSSSHSQSETHRKWPIVTMPITAVVHLPLDQIRMSWIWEGSGKPPSGREDHPGKGQQMALDRPIICFSRTPIEQCEVCVVLDNPCTKLSIRHV
jgi:hypothetical protein